MLLWRAQARSGPARTGALVLAGLSAGIGFVAIPIDTVQWLYAALFMVNAAILTVLVWIKKAV